MAVLVDIQRAAVRTSDRVLFEELSLTISEGERVGVVGINGTGKSTLLQVLAGARVPDEGRLLRGRSVRVGYLGQDRPLPSGTVREMVGGGWEGEAVLQRLGMAGELASDIASLSGGQAKRVALARVLVAPADLLVLDEPTNHLDLAAVAWLEDQLLSRRGGLVLVSHDRHLLDRLTTRMVELYRGRSYVHDGGYGAYLEEKVEREDQAAAAEATRRNLARRELAWLRRGAPARTRKPQARIDAAIRVVESRPEAAARGANIDLSFGTPRLGDRVIECIAVGFSHEHAAAPVLSGVDLDIGPRSRLGVVGPNGSGKSTLLDLLAGRRQPSTGVVERGPTVVVGYHDQNGADLDPEARVRDLVAGPTRVPGSPEDQALMERFWFTGELPWARVATLSGGERRRLQLLLVLAARPNVVLLDEPTNDLDLDTIRIVEDFFEHWPGALVVVSHDRTFLDRTVEDVVALETEGALAPVPGGVAGWLARAAPSSPRPPADPAPALAATRGQGTDTGGAPPRRRSSSTVGRQLREAEKELARLTRQRDMLAAELGVTVDHVELARIGTELSQLQEELAAAEELWLTLAQELEAAR